MWDEDDKETQFEFLDEVEYNGKEYVVLLPLDEAGDEGLVEILEVVEKDLENDIEKYVGVDDDAILSAVFDIFQERFGEEDEEE
ncbi:MAG: DUF1292 domain-containing protein [Lachnospiraceae bacterium]|nr:DUF1292 domain-containing protein [Lachnospiraceae bacterium]